MEESWLSSHSAKQVHRAATAPGPTSQGTSQWLEYPSPPRPLCVGSNPVPLPLKRALSCLRSPCLFCETGITDSRSREKA